MLHSLIIAAAVALAGPQVGAPAPDFHLITIEGKHLDLRALRGKTVVLNDWATWCPPCREETPDLYAAARKAGTDVVFVGVDSTEAAPIVRAFAAAKSAPYAQVAMTALLRLRMMCAPIRRHSSSDRTACCARVSSVNWIRRRCTDFSPMPRPAATA